MEAQSALARIPREHATMAAADCNKRPAHRVRRLGRRMRGYAQRSMTIGTSLLLIAVGAILKYAVTADVSGIDLQTVGVILMLVGILGLILSLLYTFVWSDAARRRRAPEGGYYDDRTQNLPPRDRY
jgi:Domain of unknown function (DUF6458)